ncbi:MAG: hypothetical protein NTZ78_08655 [Candidatus Aureabacteria bacterium]|nr:hypothetical protein [Candidatus Auribacterota bacterium]
MKMHRATLFILLWMCFMGLGVAASTDTLEWAKRAGGSGFDDAISIAAYPDGTSMVTGIFSGTATFGFGESNETTLTTTGTSAVFIAKHNADGTLAWVKKATEGGEARAHIASCPDGASMITGWFYGSIKLGLGEPHETTLSSAGQQDIFIAKYNADGKLAWAKRASGTSDEAASSIASYSDGTSVVMGMFYGATTFGIGESNQTTLIPIGGSDIFIAKYNANGTLAWVKGEGGNDRDYSGRIVSFADGTFVTEGSFDGTATFGLGEPNETTLTSAGEWDIFIAKFYADGTLMWVKRAGGSGYDEANITTCSDGSLMAAGYFCNTCVFGPGESKETTLTSAGAQDIFIAKYNADGTLAWAKRAGGDARDEGGAITSYPDGSCMAAGFFSGTSMFGQGESNETTLTSAGDWDIFVAKYNADGSLAWVKRAGGTGGDVALSIVSFSDGTSVIAGWFEETAVFGQGEANETTLTSAGSLDIFIAKYRNPTEVPPQQSQAEFVLNGSSFSFGNQLTATFQLNESITRAFNAYAVIIMPEGNGMLDMMTLSPKISPVASKVPSLPAGFSRQLLSVVIPLGAPKGGYELLVAFFDPNTKITGRQDAFLQVSAKFLIQ